MSHSAPGQHEQIPVNALVHTQNVSQYAACYCDCLEEGETICDFCRFSDKDGTVIAVYPDKEDGDIYAVRLETNITAYYWPDELTVVPDKESANE